MTGTSAIDEAISDLVAANRILANEGVLDGFGHVSIRHPGKADTYFMSRSIAPALVTAADVIEHDLENNAVHAEGPRPEALLRALDSRRSLQGAP